MRCTPSFVRWRQPELPPSPRSSARMRCFAGTVGSNAQPLPRSKKIQNRRSQPRDSLGKISVAAIQDPVAKRKHRAAAEQPQRDAPRWSNPIVVEGVFQEECDGERQRQNPDIEKPSAGELAFRKSIPEAAAGEEPGCDELPVTARGCGSGTLTLGGAAAELAEIDSGSEIGAAAGGLRCDCTGNAPATGGAAAGSGEAGDPDDSDRCRRSSASRRCSRS